MKKVLVVLTSVLALFLVACGNEMAETGTETEHEISEESVNTEKNDDFEYESNSLSNHSILGEWQNVGLQCCYGTFSSLDGTYNGVGMVTRFYPNGTFIRYVIEGHWRFLVEQSNSDGEYVIDTGNWYYIDGTFKMNNQAQTMNIESARIEFDDDTLLISEFGNQEVSRRYSRVNENGPFVDNTHIHGILGTWHNLEGANLFERTFLTGDSGIFVLNSGIIDWFLWEIERSDLIRIIENDVVYFITSPDYFDNEITLHNENMEVIGKYNRSSNR